MKKLFFNYIHFKNLFFFFFFICIITPFISLVICLSLAINGAWGELPNFEELENPKSNLATEIISADNTIIGNYFYENRTHVEFKDLSLHLINALIAKDNC